MTPAQWIVGHDTGISSRTIWAVMMGVEPHWPGAPLDPSDFGRCWRLLVLFPEWKARLAEVAEKYPEWRQLVQHWRDLELLYAEELGNKSGKAPKLYARMQELLQAGRTLSGAQG